MIRIMTAEFLDANDIANGTVRVYGPDDTHTDADVWRRPGPAPDGVWIFAAATGEPLAIETSTSTSSSATFATAVL